MLTVLVGACRSTYQVPASELPRLDGGGRGMVRGVRTKDGLADVDADDLITAVPVARDGITLMVHPQSAVAIAVPEGDVPGAEHAGWSELDRELEMPLRARIETPYLVVDDGNAPPLAIPGAAIDHVVVARRDAAKTVGLVMLCVAGTAFMTGLLFAATTSSN
jgi:hypothetical protein